MFNMELILGSINTFIQQGLFKVTVKTFIMLQNISFSNKFSYFSTKILSSITVFNIDDNHKCLLRSKSEY